MNKLIYRAECTCSDAGHNLRLMAFDGDELYIDYEINRSPSFLYRLWHGIKLAFNRETSIGAHYGEMVLSRDDVDTLIANLQKFKALPYEHGNAEANPQPDQA